jgi:hypothetical protein
MDGYPDEALISNRPYFVGSQTSGVDGSSEGGRLSTIRLPSVLTLYSVPLLQAIREAGYKGKLSAQPALDNGTWVLEVTYEGERPPWVPERWHGHRVVLKEQKPAGG